MYRRVDIREAGPADAQAWNAYVDRNPKGNAYQLYGFGSAVESAYGYAIRYLMACTGQQITGVLPLIHVRRPLGKGALVSLPYCDAGGILSDDPTIEEALLAAARERAQALNCELAVRSIVPIMGLNPAETENQDKVGMLLDLPESPDRLMASFKAKLRSQVKKPLRDGLVVEMGGQELLDAFYGVFCENMRDLGSPAHSREWFKQILKGYGNRAHIGLVRMPDGQPAAAGMILCHRQRISIPWASSLRRYNRWNPNMLLYWQFLSHATTLGARHFDFGRSTPGQGTHRFKKQWGAVQTPLHWATFDRRGEWRPEPHSKDEKNAGGKTPGLRDTASRILSTLPVPVLTWVGTRTRRYITL